MITGIREAQNFFFNFLPILLHHKRFFMKKQFKCTLSSPPLHVGYSKKNIPAIERGSDLEMMTEDNFITEDKEEEGKVMKSGK